MNLRCILCRLLACVAMMVPPGSIAAPAPWTDVPYTHFASNNRLEAVLAEFASGFSMSLSVQPEVQGMVTGRFATRSPTEFLNKLGGMYGFVWYTHAGTLFVSRASDVVTRGLAAPGGNVGALRKALGDLGVLEPRFGWGELAEQGMVLVSGPATYVTLVDTTIRNLPARAQQIMVFRLQHASAIDRVVSYRDQQILTPGLATILRAAVSGGGVGLAETVSGGLMLRPAAQLGDMAGGAAGRSMPASAGAASAPPSAGPASAFAPQGTRPPSIQADPRLNALIIQDMPERMPVYQQLIAQLDVPTVLVEIEAMIVDVSTDRTNELGVDWTGRLGRTNFSAGAAGGSLTFSSTATAAGNFLITQLRALETKGDAEIRSRPSVLTSENLQAVLDLSETFYIRSEGERVASVTPVTAGTTLKVTPHVFQQGGQSFVRLRLDIEDGQIADELVGTLPIVRRTSVSTEATVLQGEALLIAGYTSDRQVMSRRQLPVLGELPGVGALFGSRTGTVQKRERMFLIRPKVVQLASVAQMGSNHDR